MNWVAPVILCGTIGFLVVSLLWPSASIASDFPLKISLTTGCGLGVFSVVFFLSLLLSRSLSALVTMDLVVATTLGGIFVWLTRNRSGQSSAATPEHPRLFGGWIGRVLTTSFGIALVGSLYACLKWAQAEPEGTGWDSFAIWNLHARVLFRGGEHWRDGFSNLIAWSHPDYPLLLPASIAHFWSYLGQETALVPAMIGMVFAFSTIGLLFSTVRVLRGNNQALLAATVLAGTPFFIEQGISQYADVPLSFFLLATLALLCLYDHHHELGSSRLKLAGLMAGFAAWTKNEGLLFLVALLIACAVVPGRRRWNAILSRMPPLVAGMAPLVLVVAYFKIHVAPSGDLFSNPNSMLEKIADPARYWLIVRWFAKDFFLFGHWALIPGTVVAAIYAWLMGIRIDRQPESGIRISALALLLTVAGYFAIFVITPYDLGWHLRYSLNRLFAQLWPSVLFLFFLVVRTPEEALGPAPGWNRQEAPEGLPRIEQADQV